MTGLDRQHDIPISHGESLKEWKIVEEDDIIFLCPKMMNEPNCGLLPPIAADFNGRDLPRAVTHFTASFSIGGGGKGDDHLNWQ